MCQTSFEVVLEKLNSCVFYIFSCASKCLKLYNTTLEEDESQLQKTNTLSSRQIYSLYTTHGQKQILQKIF